MERGIRAANWLVVLWTLFTIFFVNGSLGSEETRESDSTQSVVQREAFKSNIELGKVQRQFDYFVFAQQWPGTYCKQSGSCCKKVAVPATFTVHGLWPENEDGSYPSCCTGPGFDQDKIDELTDLLQKYWPTMSCSSPKQCSGKTTGSFWQHEWEKHGTCSYPIIPDEATYFTVGLNLRLKYDITKMLNDAGFVPSSSKRYNTRKVVRALQRAVGAKPVISCKSKQINEVWICVTQDLQIRDCGSSSNSCPNTILIPPFQSGSSDGGTNVEIQTI